MMFRLLGLLAALDLRLNRIRFNFVPLNLAVAGLLLWGVSLGVTRVADGPGDAVPQTVTVADLVAGRIAAGSFVRVSGFVEPGVVLELGKSRRGGKLESVHERLRLLHDSKSQAVWLRPRPSAIDFEGRATFVGLVRPLPEGARNATAREGGTIGSRAPSMDVLVEHGTRPRSFLSGAVHLALCAPPLALLAWVWVRRGVIFREGRRAAVEEGRSDGPIDMRVSGRMRLDGRTSRRFVEVGAQLGWIERGGLAIVANVDASSYMMGFRAIACEGLWTLAIPGGAALSIVPGEVAFGTGVRPAVRVAVRVDGRVTNRLTLTFGSSWQRERVLQVLSANFVAQRPSAAA